jgi:hypothetical protein
MGNPMYKETKDASTQTGEVDAREVPNYYNGDYDFDTRYSPPMEATIDEAATTIIDDSSPFLDCYCTEDEVCLICNERTRLRLRIQSIQAVLARRLHEAATTPLQ